MNQGALPHQSPYGAHYTCNTKYDLSINL